MKILDAGHGDSPLIPAPERQARRSPGVQGQPGSHSQFQVSLGQSETLLLLFSQTITGFSFGKAAGTVNPLAVLSLSGISIF